MVTVFIPTQWQALTAGQTKITSSAKSLGELLRDLRTRFADLGPRLESSGGLPPGLSVLVGDQFAHRGLLTPLPADCEVHFLPAMGAG